MKSIAIKIITKQIKKWDPMQLLEGGAPDDEYEDEIEQILKAVLKSKDEIELAEEIKDIFDYAFRRDFRFDNCLIVAKNIWKELYE